MKKSFVAVPLLLAVPPAFAQSNLGVGEKTGVNSVIGKAPSTPEFVTEAAISDMFEIKSSQLALDRADAPTKSFAQQMIADHTKTSTEMKSMVQSGTVSAQLPTDLDKAHQDRINKLSGMNGADFTKQYHSEQVSAHKVAVDLFKRYGEGGDNASLKTWASGTRPALEHHLAMAQDLNK